MMQQVRRLAAWLIVLVLLCLWAWSTSPWSPFPTLPPQAASATAHVVDGDTLIANGITFRLYGIDAPEYHQDCTNAAGQAYPCGRAARAQLEALVLPGSVQCLVRAEDRYHRSVATCGTSAVQDLSQAMVSAGQAISPAERGTAPYAEEEAAAQAAKRGIWQGPFETPALWRAAHPRLTAPTPSAHTVPNPTSR